MLGFYDLYDLHAIIIGIRAFPQNPINQEILSAIITLMKNKRENTASNQIRSAIKELIGKNNDELYTFALTENVYSYYPSLFLNDEKVYQVLISALESLLAVLQHNDICQIYDLADCLHDLPIIIAENNYKITSKYWKCEVRYYRKKWDRNFLREEQRLLKRMCRKCIKS